MDINAEITALAAYQAGNEPGLARDQFVEGALWSLASLSGLGVEQLRQAVEALAAGSRVPAPPPLPRQGDRPEVTFPLDGAPLPSRAMPPMSPRVEDVPGGIRMYGPGGGVVTKEAIEPPEVSDLSAPVAPETEDSMEARFKAAQASGDRFALPMDPETLAEVERAMSLPPTHPDAWVDPEAEAESTDLAPDAGTSSTT
jgi:hypothetical protein